MKQVKYLVTATAAFLISSCFSSCESCSCGEQDQADIRPMESGECSHAKLLYKKGFASQNEVDAACAKKPQKMITVPAAQTNSDEGECASVTAKMQNGFATEKEVRAACGAKHHDKVGSDLCARVKQQKKAGFASQADVDAACK